MKPINRDTLRSSLMLALMLIGAGLYTASAQDSTYYAPAIRDRGNLLDYCPDYTFGASTACEFTDPAPLPYREFAQYFITIPANTSFDLAITVASNRGDVDIRLLGPDGSVVSASSERIGSDVVQVRRTALQRAPGNYTLSVQAVAQSMSEYTVRTQTTASVTRLHPAELALVAAIAAQCCSPDDDLLPDSCTRLNAAISPNATDDDDLCLQPPNICDSQGRLTKLVLSGGDKGNFICPSFPRELGNFTQLQVLDWTSNSQVGTLASVAAVLAPLSSTLRRLYLGRNALSGPLECALVSLPNLEVLRLDSNVLSGSIPSCLFRSASLRYVSLAGNMLSGSIPQLPADCGLNILDLSDNGPPNGPSANNPGFSGSLPDLLNAANLTSLDVSSNSLTGTIPALPSGLQVLKASYNNLTGPLPPSLDVARDLRVLDLSRNRLSGTLSGETTNNELLTVLHLAGNRLGGELPYSSWGSFLVDVDLSENNFTGAFSTLLNRPSLINLNLAYNNLTFDISDLARKLVTNNSMLYFNISKNAVHGQLSADLGKMRLFHQLLLQAVDDEALQGSMPPQPLFDISFNNVNSTFPIGLLPLLSQLFWASPFDNFIPLTVKLQPQNPSYGLACPAASVPVPEDVYYLDELQTLYNMTCQIPSGLQVNISAYQDMQKQPARPPRPPKPPAPPRPPPQAPPRPPRRRPPPPPDAPGTNSNSSSNNGTSTSKDGSGGGGSQTSDRNSTSGGDGGSIIMTPTQGLPPPTASLSPPPPPGGSRGAAVGAAEGGNKGGASIGPVIGGVVGGLVAVAALAGLGWVAYQRHRRNAYSSTRRIPLTHNSTYEPAPSEGTASNFADMQMFELRPADRPPRQRNRML